MSREWVNSDERQGAVELYIDTGDKDENKRIFDALRKHQAEIERSFGNPLSWERLDDKRASRVRSILKEGGLNAEEKWPVIQEAMIGAMDKLAKAVKPFLAKA